MTLVAAQRGAWSLDESVFVARAKDSFKGWDLGLSGLWVGGDRVIGLSVAGTISEVSVYGDFTYTWRAQSGELAQADAQRLTLAERDPFIRATLGGAWRWMAGGGGSLNIEAAWLGDGASAPSEYLVSASDPRVMSGERWLLGQAYGSVGVTQALDPLLNASLTVISNLHDPSALLGPGLSWSVSDEVSALLGGYVGLGAGLSTGGSSPIPTLQSELGALRWLAFAMLSAYY